MTPRELKRICRDLNLYSTPELNDKIYLHYKGEAAMRHVARGSGRQGGAPLLSTGCAGRSCSLSAAAASAHPLPLLTPLISPHSAATGFKKIENLDEYTGLKVIYLEGNGTNEATHTQLNPTSLNWRSCISFA